MLRFVLVSLVASVSLSAVAAPFQDLAQFRGCWRGNSPQGILTERWTSPQDNTMFGSDSLSDAGGHNLVWGAMTILNTASGIQFLYSDDGSAYQMFKLVDFQGGGRNFAAAFTSDVTREGFNHLVMTLKNNRTLTIRLSGPEPSQPFELKIQRLSTQPDCK